MKARPDADDVERTTHKYYPLVRPLVLRACAGDTVTVRFNHHIRVLQDGLRGTSR